MTNFVAAFALIISVVGTSLTAIVQVKSEAHDKELYQQFKQDIDNEENTSIVVSSKYFCILSAVLIPTIRY
jgi:hypothetical protein